MDVVRLSNAGATLVVAALALLSGTHLGRAQTSAPTTGTFTPSDELARRPNDAWRPADPTPAFSVSGPILPPTQSTRPTIYSGSLYPLPRFRSRPDSTFDALIEEASRRFGIPAGWVRGVMRIESGGRTMLHGRPITSPAGAMGLMQVMPTTFAELSGRYGFGADPYDPRANILAGTAYLREMYDRFGAAHFLAAYNAGPGRVDNHLRSGRPLPGETQRYVQALASELGRDTLVGGTVASSTVRDLTSVDAIRPAALPSPRRPSDRPSARQVGSIFITASAPPVVVDRQSDKQPNHALFVRLTHQDQRADMSGRDASEE